MELGTGSRVLDELGVSRVINGRGWITAVGGSIMPPEVVEAMTEAVNLYVDLHELNVAAGKVIARHTGAEAGLVVAGAGAGLLLQAAACMTRGDQEKIDLLPDTSGMKNEVVLYRGHHTSYDRIYRAAGARLIVWGKGKGDDEEGLLGALSDRTAAIAYVFHPWNHCPVPIERVVEIARERDIPVIVDAAVMLPPVENLTKYIRQGADMVTFSGGKGLRGPQSTGILAGRADLIEAARLNMSPYAGIGRPAKVCKEEIVGLVAALRLFVEADHEAEWAGWRAGATAVVHALQGIPGVSVRLEEGDPNRQGPVAAVYFDPGWKGPSSSEILERLAARSPSIRLGQGNYADEIFVAPITFQPGDDKIVAAALREELMKTAPGVPASPLITR